MQKENLISGHSVDATATTQVCFEALDYAEFHKKRNLQALPWLDFALKSQI